MLRAVVRFARDVARLPSFPRETPRHAQATAMAISIDDEEEEEEDDDDELVSSVLKLVALDPVPGEVLPRSETTWLALLPFADWNDKAIPAMTKTERVRARRAFVELVARLAESGRFRWDTATMHCGEMVGPERAKSADNAFWFDLLRALWPGAASDAEQPLERNLIALSRARRPRFLLCIDHDVAKGDVFSALEQFLLPPDEDAEPVLFGPAIVDGLPDEEDLWEGVEVEIGLSFTQGRFSQAAMTQLLDVVDRVHASRHGEGVRFRVTTLRFGRDCSFHARALELLGQHRRRTPNAVRSIRLGNLSDVRVPSRRAFFMDLTRGHAFLSRLALSSDESFVPLAAAIRNGGASHLQELDVRISTTDEHAAWLAFAFFHADSRSSVSSLCLRVPGSPLSVGWLDVFTRVLRSIRAERDLARMEGGAMLFQPGQGPVRTLVRLQKDVLVKSSPSQGSKSMCSLIDTTHEEFELLARFKNAVALVIPGVGIGWVPSTRIVSERVTPSHVLSDGGVYTNRQVSSFTWDSSAGHFHVEVLMELLAIVGAPLHCLQLPAHHVDSDHLRQILRFCPNLTELNVSGHMLHDIEPLREAYENGDCKIKALSIARATYRPLDEGELTTAMTEILKGGGRHVLRKLVVHTLPPRALSRPDSVWDNCIVPLANAVSATTQLEYLHLPGLSLFANGALQRLPVDFTLCPLSFSPMPLRAKLAFLSVVSRFSSQRSLGRLDASVLSVIFRFSYDCNARRVLKDARLAMDTCKCKECL